MRISPLLVVSVLVPSMPACSDQIPGFVCTESFAFVLVSVQTAAGAPIAGLTISDTVLRSKSGFTVPQGGGPRIIGDYVIMDDNFRSHVRTTGDSVRVTGHAGGMVFAADYVFDVPDGCHVRKVSGPDPVIVP